MFKLKTQIKDLSGKVKEITIVKNPKEVDYYEILSVESGKQLGYIQITVERYSIKVNLMFNTSSLEGEKHINVGTALHELAFKLSELHYKKRGNVRLGAGYTSLLFHYGCGFRLPPVDRKDPKLSWGLLDKAFRNHPKYGMEAYARWKSPDIQQEKIKSFASDASANDVLEFYYQLYKSIKDDQEKAYLINNLENLMEVGVYLPKKTIEQKKEEYNILNHSAPSVTKFSLIQNQSENTQPQTNEMTHKVKPHTSDPAV